MRFNKSRFSYQKCMIHLLGILAVDKKLKQFSNSSYIVSKVDICNPNAHPYLFICYGDNHPNIPYMVLTDLEYIWHVRGGHTRGVKRSFDVLPVPPPFIPQSFEEIKSHADKLQAI